LLHKTASFHADVDLATLTLTSNNQTLWDAARYATLAACLPVKNQSCGQDCADDIYMSLSAADLNDVCVSVVKRICNQLTWLVVTGRVRTLPSLHRTHAACYRWLSETLANSWSYVL